MLIVKRRIKKIFKKIIPPSFRMKLRRIIKGERTKVISEELLLLRLRYIFKFSSGNAHMRRTILFYPNFPSREYMIYKICRILGWKMSNDFKKPFDICIYWKDATYRSPDSILLNIAKTHLVINIRSTNIDKKYIDSVFKKIFGYSTLIDPTVHVGYCVRKPLLNAQHAGVIVKCPIYNVERNYIYQKLIDNRVGENCVYDIRTPIVKKTIPFVYIKYRPLTSRFRENLKSFVKKTDEVFSEEEKNKIIRFCEEIGLDYGELDVLRDNKDGLLYIVDVNNTPFGPPRKIYKEDKIKALFLLAKTFAKVYG